MKPFKMEYVRLLICTSRAAEINHITTDHKSTKREMLGALNHVCGEVIQLLLKYCIYCVSAAILHRDSLIKHWKYLVVQVRLEEQ